MNNVTVPTYTCDTYLHMYSMCKEVNYQSQCFEVNTRLSRLEYPNMSHMKVQLEDVEKTTQMFPQVKPQYHLLLMQLFGSPKML